MIRGSAASGPRRCVGQDSRAHLPANPADGRHGRHRDLRQEFERPGGIRIGLYSGWIFEPRLLAFVDRGRNLNTDFRVNGLERFRGRDLLLDRRVNAAPFPPGLRPWAGWPGWSRTCSSRRGRCLRHPFQLPALHVVDEPRHRDVLRDERGVPDPEHLFLHVGLQVRKRVERDAARVPPVLLLEPRL